MSASLILEHYEVLTHDDGALFELGRGAMGITYKGLDTRLRVPVALKVINSAHLHSESARQRFVREARSAAQLRHRNVASVFHLGEQDGNYFYAMEFIDGETVEALVKRQGALSPVLALRITAQVARALNAAQTHDLVHRDIKPANLMVVEEDDDLVVKVIDFGLAKVSFAGTTEPTDEPLTQGGFLGTPHFASPEQLEERDIDVRSDIYSLGVTLWYLLHGSTPFSGSVARVIGQHLSKPPPFEELASVPEVVVALLRRMLAKDPVERPQTPSELRKEVERCLTMILDPADGALLRRKENQADSAADALTVIPDDVRFESGATIAQRYLITHELGENEAGISFRARDLQEDREVRLLVLHRELFADGDTFGQIESEAGALITLDHPNVLAVFELASTDRNAFVTLAWTDGFTLRELLRTRRELPAAEVLRLLAPAAAGLDHAAERLPRLELGLHHVFLHFPGREVPAMDLLPCPVAEWPDFVVKVNPLATWRDLFALTWAAGQTLVGGAAHHDRQSLEGRAGAVRAFAAIIYELLGGVATGIRAGDYAPLAALDEAGNAVLHRGLFTPEAFPSAAAFIEQFAAPPAVGGSSAPRPRPQPMAPPPRVEPESSTHSPTEYPTLAMPPDASPFAPPRRRSVLVPGLILVTAGIATFALFQKRVTFEPPALTQVTPLPIAPTPAVLIPPMPKSSPSPTPAPAPAPTPGPIVRMTTPLPAAPSPIPARPTPPPPPSRTELASAARRAAEALEARQKNGEALAAWIRMARDFPEWDTGRMGAELLVRDLRRRPGGLSHAQFTAMQADLLKAARMGVLEAMMALGEELRETDPQQAFAWYCTAAEGGEPLAMTQAGLMLSNGAGTVRDMRKAAAYFREAADQGEPAAMAALAECHLDGEGVPADKQKALALLQTASQKGNARARNRLGWCYHQGVGVERNDREAFRLFTEAAEKGSVEAIGNLGVLYIKGEGVPKNEGKAVEKFKEASLKGDVNSMYFYAGCLENELGVKGNSATAKTWFVKAAEAGHVKAAAWCRSKGIAFKPAR